VVGYNLYSGVASQTYTNMLSVGNVTNGTVAGLVPGTTYYFSVVAVDSLGDESPFCNEVTYLVSTNSTSTPTNTPPTGTSTPTNTPPAISSIAYQTISANSSTPPLAFTISDAQTPATNLVLSAASSNPTLVPNNNISLSGTGTNWTVVATPAPGQTGTTTIALTVCDPSLCTTMSFQLTVNPLPTISLTSPVRGASYIAPATLNLSASVTANGHTISQVQFFNGSALIGTAKAAPYALNWTGIAAGSYSLSATAVFDAGSTVVSASIPTTIAAAPRLSAPWQTLDIGAVGVAGSESVSNGLYTLQGAGTISGSADSFRFLFQNLTGNGEIRAQVQSLQNTSANALSGVMIRESLTSGSRYALMRTSPSGTIQWLSRSKTGGGTSTTKGGSGALPNLWLRVVRAGNTFYGYKSSNGTSWTLVNSSSITMATNIYVGLVVASGSTTTLTKSASANVYVVP
jgi:hypothetical protein